MTNRLKTYLLIFTTVLLLIGVPSFFLPEKQFGADDIIKKNKVTDELKIKAEKKGDILYSFVDDICIDQNGPECKKTIKAVKYVYKTNNKVTRQDRFLDGGVLKETTKDKNSQNKDIFLGADMLIENIELRTVNQLAFPYDSSTTLYQVYSGAKYFYDNPDWYEVDYASTTIDAYNIQMDSNFATSSDVTLWLNIFSKKSINFLKHAFAETVYSSAHDDEIYKSGSSWNTFHDATSGTLRGGNTIYCGSYWNGASFGAIYRIMLPFNISVSGTITAASLSIYTSAIFDQDNDSYDFITVVQGNPASDTSYSVDDYNNIGSSVDSPTEGIDSGDRKDLTSAFATNQYRTFTLNSTGMGWIPTSGYVHLGLREGHDTLDHPMSGNTSNYIAVDSSENTNDPYLTLTVSAGGGGSRRIIITQ